MEGKFENGILGLVPQKEWLSAGFRVKRPNDPIDGLFGDERTDNIVAYWQTVAEEYQVPMMAQFHGFDTQARTTFRVPVDTHNIEKGLIKVKINQSERIRELIKSGVREDEMYRYVINDGVRLAEQVVTRTKVAKNELMATGKVTIKENNLDLTIDYGVPDDQLAFELDLSEGADVPGQLQKIVDAALEKGVTLNGMQTSRANLTKMRQNTAMQTAVNGNIGKGALIRRDALEAYLESELGITRIITNDLTYGADTLMGADGRPIVTKKRYYPKDKVTFFALGDNGRLGVGVWGDPPEAGNGNFLATATSEESQYIYVTQWMEADPAVLWTKASALFIPVLYNPGSLWVAKVNGAAGE